MTMSNSSSTLKLLGFTFLGGALGAVTRGFITQFGSDPIDIFIANIVGSFILALAMTVPVLATPERQAFLGSGFAGGFTTLSGIAILAVLGKLSPDIVVAYISLSIIFGLLSYWLGDTVGRRIKRAGK
jgi:fluoride ion exporter CrcB/FEX